MSRAKFPPDAIAFLAALGAKLEGDDRLITCAFRGDPGAAEPTDWRPRPYKPGGVNWVYPTSWNAYVTVGAFGRAEDGTYRRRAATYLGGMAFMVDDVGTKVAAAAMRGLPPSARVLTSPGNEQWWYFLDKPERDAARFDALIRAFIAGPLEGNDPGMASVTRVGRIPGFTNGKPIYGGDFLTQLEELNNNRYSMEDLIAGFGVELIGRREPLQRLVPADAETRIAAHFATRQWLAKKGMLKREKSDRAGWTEMICPWTEGHTGGVDNGAAIRQPEIENGFFGGWKCHHGSCAERGWKDLTDWVSEQAAEDLDAINESSEYEIK